MRDRPEFRTGNVAGRITDQDTGQPLFGVSVTTNRGAKATTDLRGRYFLSNVPSGECTAECVQPGYKTLSAVPMNVKPGDTIQQDCPMVCKNRIPLNQPVVLLPLRLEIRRVFPQVGQTIQVARYTTSTANTPFLSAKEFEPIRFTSTAQSLVAQHGEYWIRWYPDTIHYLTPVGKITETEKTAWTEFFQVYEQHKDLGSVKGLYQQPPYSLDLDTLAIHYGTKPGRLTDDEMARCQAYDAAARELIRNEVKGVREALAWRDLENPETKASWIAFVKAVGPIRARQIAKHMTEGDWDFDTESEMEEEPLEILMNRGMPLTSLPEEISLYTINNRRAVLLIDGIEINRQNLFVAPTDFAGTQWMTDFQKAVQEGMGVVISDPAKVQQIDQAEWLIAVGVNQTADSRSVLENVLRRNNAKGEFSILAQDSPTNNTEAAPTQFSELEPDAETYLRNTYMRIPTESSVPDLISQLRQSRTDTQRLAHVLNLSNRALSEIAGANSAEMTEAAAMSALLWTPCTWHYQQLRGSFFNQYFPVMSRFLQALKPGEFFVNNVRGRGTLPIIRVEDNPYGIVPVVALGDWAKNISRNNQFSVTDADSIFQFVDSFKQRFLALSQNAPKLDLTTGDDKYETLVEILKSAPVAKRTDVRPFDSAKPADMSENPKYLTCALVREGAEGVQPTVDNPFPEVSYLRTLSNVNKPGFDPASFQIDANSPLLKRILKHLLDLAFMQLGRPPVTNVGGGGVRADTTGTVIGKRGFDTAGGTTFHTAGSTSTPIRTDAVFSSQDWVATTSTFAPATPQFPGGLDLIAEAASLLRRVHPDKLEILLLETLDLFSHRLDAWLTGLANSLLEECQRQNKQSPPVGMYGWLEKPGMIAVRMPHPEFIQAPSVKQASTAAILRNASIHNGTDDNSGAFQINLSSEQIRKGTWYMEGLRQGHLPGELLGYRLERMIHEESKKPSSQILDRDVFELRDKYPLTIQETKDETGQPTATLTIIDGEKFLNDSATEVRFNDIKAKLNRIKDAAADIALCEVIDANDNVARQGGWLDFLDGDGLPPREEFIRSQRSGDVHGTKIFLVLPSPQKLEAKVNETNPRVIADPLLARFCESLMPDFETREIVAQVSRLDGTQSRPVTLIAKDLNMQPIDLVIGGAEELKLRTRYHLLSCWKENDPNDLTTISPCNILGPFPNLEESDELLNEVAIELIPPTSAADKLNVLHYVEKAARLRQLIHQNQGKNGLGTVAPSDIPLVNQDELAKLDPIAGFELLVKRVRRIRDQLIRLISTTITATTELKRRDLILRGLRSCQTLVQRLKETADDQTVHQLKARVSNLIATDADFKALAQSSQLPALIQRISDGPEAIETLEQKLADLEKEFVVHLESSAKELVVNPALRLREISQFGLEQALTVLPDQPTVASSLKILKHFDQLVSALIEKLRPLISDSMDLQNNVQSLKVVYLHAEEFNDVLHASPNRAEAIAQLKNRLPLTDEQLQIVTARQPASPNYVAPLLQDLLRTLDGLKQTPTASEKMVSDLTNASGANREEVVSIVKTKTAEVISQLQAATDKEGLVVLTPYLLTRENQKRPDWTIDLSSLTAMVGSGYLQEYQKLRPAVANVLRLFDLNEVKFYEDKRHQRIEPGDSASKKQGNTDILYLAPRKIAKSTECLTVLLIDQWQEGIPNPEGTEITGIALQYDAPQTEAPNAVIIAVPPYLSNTDVWSTELLAKTLLETIELMQIRLVNGDDVRGDFLLNWLFQLPATVFPPAKDGSPMFPSRSQLFHIFDLGTVSGYVLANKLSSDDLSKTTATFIRSEAPKIGGKQ